MAAKVIVAVCCLAALMLRAGTSPAEAADRIKTLLFAGGEIHDGKGNGDVVQKALEEAGYFDVTRVHEDLDALTAEKLEPYELIVFFYTVGEINDAQKNGVLNSIASGKGFIGWHSAADSFRDCPDWKAFIGGHFITHPPYRRFQVSVVDENNFITKGMTEFMVEDEQYILDYDPRVKILCSALWKGEAMPVAWTKSWGKGRVCYISLGHDPKACRQDVFQKLLIRGALWAANRENATK